MSENAQPQAEEVKKHGDPLDNLLNKAEETTGELSRKEQDNTQANTAQQSKE